MKLTKEQSEEIKSQQSQHHQNLNLQNLCAFDFAYNAYRSWFWVC